MKSLNLSLLAGLLWLTACSPARHGLSPSKKKDAPSPPPSSGWEVGSGGDGVRITFAKAKFLAAEMARDFRPLPGITRAEQDRWIGQNQARLARDIVDSPHLWLEKTLAHDAMTQLTEAAVIRLSLPLCRQFFDTQDAAAELLLHESAHHLGVSDEAFADSIAAAITKSYRRRYPLVPGRARTVPLAAYPEARNLVASGDIRDDRLVGFPPSRYGAFGGGKLFLWSGTQPSGLLYDPVLRTWSRAASTGQPSARDYAFVSWMKDRFLVWGGQELRPSLRWRKDGALYDPVTARWTAFAGPDSKGSYPVASPEELILLGVEPSPNGGEHYSLIGDAYRVSTGTWIPLPKRENTRCREIADSAVSTGPRPLLALVCDEMHGSIWDRHRRTYLFDLNAWRWIADSTNRPAGRFAAGNYLEWKSFQSLALIGIEDGFFLAAHSWESGTKEFRAARFDAGRLSWEEVALDRFAPSEGSRDYQAVWDGKQVLLFGRGSEGFPVHKYHLGKKSWELLSLPDPALSFPTTKNLYWTGESMLVLGNFGPGFETGMMIEP